MITLPTIPRPKKKTHSYSAVHTFAEICERRYALERHRPWTDNVNTLRGSQIHAALEWVAVNYDPKLEPETLLIRAGEEFDSMCPESVESQNKSGQPWPLTRAALTAWLLRTTDLWPRITPMRTEFWIRKAIPGCAWPLVGKVDLLCKLDGLSGVHDWKSTNNMNKVMTQFECDRSLQGRIYCWATGERRASFAFFSQYHDAQLVTATYSEEDIAELELWLSVTCQAIEKRWQTGGWTLASPTCGLCSPTWCPEFSECVGCVRENNGVQ